MGGSSSLSIDSTMQRGEWMGGFVKDQVIDLAAFTLDSGAQLGTTALGNVYRAASATDLRAISWEATADGTDIIRLDWTLPRDFHFSLSDAVGTRSMLQLWLRWRLVDLASTSNATLNLLSNCRFHTSGFSQDSAGRVTEGNGATAIDTLGANLSVNVGGGGTPADVADATEEAQRWLTFDYTAAMTAAQRKSLRPLSSFQMYVFPSAAIGTNLRLDLTGAFLAYRGHAAPYFNTWKRLP